MNFRKANDGDREQVVGMVNALINELGGESLDTRNAEEVARRLIENEDHGDIVVAVDDADSLAGLCSLSYQVAIRTVGRYAIIQEMFVAYEYRGQGIGAELVRKAMEIASDAGCGVVELGTPANGDRQERFYRREGFDVVGLRMRRTVTG